MRALLALGLLGLATASSNPQIPLNGPSHLSHDTAGEPPTPHRQTLLSLHRSLVEISSTTHNETAVAHFLSSYLSSRGYTTELQHLPGSPRANVLAWPGPTYPGSPRLAVTSHIDVVPPHIPYAIAQDPPGPDTVISGRGSVDAKGSIAAQIAALQGLLEDGAVLPRDAMLVFVVGEEGPGDGMRHFSAQMASHDPPLDFESVIFGEPTENKLACGHKGGAFCSVEARGIAGHSGYPWLGKSANELLIRAFAEILNTDLGSSEGFGNTTVNIGRLDGGVALNVIPESARADIAIRVAIGPEDEGGNIVRERVREILDKIDPEAFTFECTHGYGVVETDCSVPGNEIPLSSYFVLIGNANLLTPSPQDFETIVVNYGTDITNLKGSHKRYLYGPGSILVAHGPDEAITVGELEKAVEDYKRLILHALGK